MQDYIANNKFTGYPAWQLCANAPQIILKLICELNSDYIVKNQIAIHTTAVVEDYTILKGPCIIGPKCFIAAFSYLRGGVWLGENVIIGPSCEIKTSFIFSNSKTAHLNFVGDSVIGNNVNIEAGAIIANYRNEKADKQIKLNIGDKIIETSLDKFGALIGDNCRIGANSVLAPGTVLKPNTIIKRLELVDQS